MVFAVWAARREYAEEHPEQVAAVQRSFLASMRDSLSRVDEIAAHAARWEPFDVATLATSLPGAGRPLCERQHEGVAEFARRGATAGAVPEDVRLRFVPV